MERFSTRNPGRAVFEHYYRELLNCLARQVGDRSDGADLAQENYVRVLTIQQSGVSIGDPRALLYARADVSLAYRASKSIPAHRVP
jgi:DNA-directed RNA polymerase specialized sigma24 family protein